MPRNRASGSPQGRGQRPPAQPGSWGHFDGSSRRGTGPTSCRPKGCSGGVPRAPGAGSELQRPLKSRSGVGGQGWLWGRARRGWASGHRVRCCVCFRQFCSKEKNRKAEPCARGQSRVPLGQDKARAASCPRTPPRGPEDGRWGSWGSARASPGPRLHRRAARPSPDTAPSPPRTPASCSGTLKWRPLSQDTIHWAGTDRLPGGPSSGSHPCPPPPPPTQPDPVGPVSHSDLAPRAARVFLTVGPAQLLAYPSQPRLPVEPLWWGASFRGQ